MPSGVSPGRGRRAAGRRGGVGEIDLGEVGHLTYLISRISCAACKVETTSQPMKMKVFTPACRQPGFVLSGPAGEMDHGPGGGQRLGGAAASFS